MVRNMVWAVEFRHEELAVAMLWLTAYVFLLRLPSEAGQSYDTLSMCRPKLHSSGVVLVQGQSEQCRACFQTDADLEGRLLRLPQDAEEEEQGKGQRGTQKAVHVQRRQGHLSGAHPVGSLLGPFARRASAVERVHGEPGEMQAQVAAHNTEGRRARKVWHPRLQEGPCGGDNPLAVSCLALYVYELCPGHEEEWFLIGHDTKSRPVEERSFHGLLGCHGTGPGACLQVQHGVAVA